MYPFYSFILFLASENLKDRLLNYGWNSDTGLNSNLKKAYQWYNVEYEYAASAEELAASQTTLRVYENEGGTEELVTSSVTDLRS